MSGSCYMTSESFFSDTMARTKGYFWWDVDFICVLVDQQAQLDIYSSWSVQQEPHVEYFYIMWFAQIVNRTVELPK